MRPFDLMTLRVALGYTQTQMAEAIGLKLRAYQDLEGGKSPIRTMHILAIERVALARAVEQGRLDILRLGEMSGVVADVVTASRMISSAPKGG